MGLEQQPSEEPLQNVEQSEPLDLRKNYNFRAFESSLVKKRKYWFCQSEPQDLSLRPFREPPFQSKADYEFKPPPLKRAKYWSCDSQPLDLSVRDYKNPEFHSSEPRLVGTNPNSSNEVELKTLMETDKNVLPILKSSIFLAPSINEDNFSCNKHKEESCLKCFCTNDEYNNKDRKQGISKGKVKTETSNSVIISNQTVEKLVHEDYKNKDDRFKKNVDVEGIHQSIGREPEEDDSPSPEKQSIESTPSQKLATKPSVAQLKKTGESFLQDGKCFEVAPKLPRCRDCSPALQETLGTTQLDTGNSLCRFYAFRKLRYSTKGFLATAGFLDPHSDATSKEDLDLWQPKTDGPSPDLDLHMAKFLLTHVADQFCDLYKQEEEAALLHMSEDKNAAWKRPVPGFREMCDVCNTTLFNFHWTCKTCGFALCIDCYRAKKGCMPEGKAVERKLICVNKRAHDQEKLMLTQIIAKDLFKQLRQKVHDVRTTLGSPLHCCDTQSSHQNNQSSPPSRLIKEFSSGEINHNVVNNNESNNGKKKENCKDKLFFPDSFTDTTDWLTFRDKDETVTFEDYNSNKENYLAILCRTWLSKPPPKNPTPCLVVSNTNSLKTHQDSVDSMAYEVILKEVIETVTTADGCHKSPLQLNTRVLTLSESCFMYPDNCPHSWLCEGRLLLLSDPSHAGNYTAFQDQWKRGQPVLVSGVLKYLDKDLWQPDSFIRDFGDLKSDLVNCMTGGVISGHYMRKFWEGFQEVTKMLKDEKGKPMLLKLKDWPPGEDFAKMLPSRFEDLMNALPLGEYTKRTGQLNLPSRLPSSFARPDLGPKMYIAYGSVIHPTKGTTNLHLDISDAVNVMVYVGTPKDIDHDNFMNEVYHTIDEACVEPVMRRRIREPSEVPGALWHIYSARDADKIRHLLTKVARERSIKLGPGQDPIHDQSWYLDTGLRDRLYREYSVRGYAIVQCLGDAVFIPAGAPHQVKNLLNCIKVAEDFVSPENVSHCLHLTQEFRKLSDFHTNHEDKLQIKNIIYHTIKDSVSVMSH